MKKRVCWIGLVAFSLVMYNAANLKNEVSCIFAV